jgi:transcriptional regulator with XRE-family HTH domain
MATKKVKKTPTKRLSPFSERIKGLIAEEGGNLRAYARKLGLPAPTLKRYRDGSEATVSKLVAIASAAGVSLQWLASGEGGKRPENGGLESPEWTDELRTRLHDVFLDSGGPEAVAKETGIPLTRIQEIDSTGQITLNEFARICIRLDAPADWLLGGRGFNLLDRFRVEKFVFEFLHDVEEIARNRQRSNRIGGSESAVWDVRGMHALLRFWRQTFEAIAPGHYLCEQVMDDNMSPTLRRGDLVFVETKAEAIVPAVYLFRKGDTLFFARSMGAGDARTLSFDSSIFDKTSAESSIPVSADLVCLGKVVYVFGPPRDARVEASIA